MSILSRLRRTRRCLPALMLLLPAALPAQEHEGPNNDRFWVSGQMNVIRQQNPAGGHATSWVETLYTGVQITDTLEVLTDIETARGTGLGNSLGTAGPPNVDAVQDESLSRGPYVSRAMLHYTLPVGGREKNEIVPAARNPMALASRVPSRRIEFRLGKMSTVDFFDLNSPGSDSHLQFMNWAVVNSATYPYAADARGYTYGLAAEYYSGNRVFRFGEMLMPAASGGARVDWNLARARGENFEFEYHAELLKKRATVARVLTFMNHTNVGSYRSAIDAFLAGKDAAPDVTRHPGSVAYGIGLNAEQELTSVARGFARLGWNGGNNGSSQADRTLQAGGDLRGKAWRRSQDQVGAVFVAGAVSGDHRRYLELTGAAGSAYGVEKTFETYYTAHIWRGFSFAVDYQRILNPGYDRGRLAAWVVSLRLHVEDAVPFEKFRK